jgi:hypothetical protein
MRRLQACYYCQFWLLMAETDGESDFVVAVGSGCFEPGTHMHVGDRDPRGFKERKGRIRQKPKGPIRGFDGSRYRICFDDGSDIVTDNLWTQGKVPERFRDLFRRFAKVETVR